MSKHIFYPHCGRKVFVGSYLLLVVSYVICECYNLICFDELINVCQEIRIPLNINGLCLLWYKSDDYVHNSEPFTWWAEEFRSTCARPLHPYVSLFWFRKYIWYMRYGSQIQFQSDTISIREDSSKLRVFHRSKGVYVCTTNFSSSFRVRHSSQSLE